MAKRTNDRKDWPAINKRAVEAKARNWSRKEFLEAENLSLSNARYHMNHGNFNDPWGVKRRNPRPAKKQYRQTRQKGSGKAKAFIEFVPKNGNGNGHGKIEIRLDGGMALMVPADELLTVLTILEGRNQQ